MSLIKRHQHRDQSSTASSPSSRKLFAGYPYPIINELNKSYEQPKSSHHSSYGLSSLRWYKKSVHKMFGMLDNLHNLNSQISILEQSFKQAQIDGGGSKSIANNLQKQTKSTRIKRIFSTSVPSPINEHEEENNKRHIRRTKLANINHQINDDQD